MSTQARERFAQAVARLVLAHEALVASMREDCRQLVQLTEAMATGNARVRRRLLGRLVNSGVLSRQEANRVQQNWQRRQR